MAQQTTIDGGVKERIRQRLFRSEAQDSLPMSIRHERIYILPTHRGMAFIFVLTIMLLASINYRLNLGYALSFILIGLFSSCLLATYQNLVKIQILMASTENTFAGSPLQYKFVLRDDHKRQRHSITLRSEHASDHFDIERNGSKEATLAIGDATRGLHKVGRLTLSSDFPLGLWRGWSYVHTPLQAYVYPKPEHPVAPFGISHMQHDRAQNAQQSEQEYAGLKSYETSDSPSQIAWKKVASGAGWYSKQFDTLAEQRELAINWADTGSQSDDEQRLSRMSAWVVKAMQENSAYTFELPGVTTTPLASGREHGHACLRALANFRSQSAA